MQDTFVAPLVIARRNAAAISLQSAFRRYQAVLWRKRAVAARNVQRTWRAYVLRKRVIRVSDLATSAAERLASAQVLLAEELAKLEAKCNPPEDAAVPAGVRALALIRGRVLDGCAARLHELVELEVVKQQPRWLTRDDVRALLRQATLGLFPEAELP